MGKCVDTGINKKYCECCSCQEDRALEEMERGIYECETAYTMEDIRRLQ